MVGVRRGAFTCVGWQVTLFDPMWQVTSRSSEMGVPMKSYIGLYLLPYLTLYQLMSSLDRLHVYHPWIPCCIAGQS